MTLLLAACGGNGNGRKSEAAQIPGAVGAATLSWTSPTENDDNSPLTDLAGFKIYFGIASGLYTNEIRIDNPSINVYIVESLDPGQTYYFTVTAFNEDDLESDFSNEVSKTAD